MTAPALAGPVTITPHVEAVEIVLTALTPISHHDPAEQDDSNQLLFNRQKQLVPTPHTQALPTQAEIDAVAALHPVPTDLAPLLADVSFPEFVGVCLVRLFLDLYNVGDGAGLFTGLERYSRLESRLRHAAVQAGTLRGCWDYLCRGLHVGIHGTEHDGLLLRTLAVPTAVQQVTLGALTRHYRSIVALARAWHGERKRQSEDYAQKAGVEQATAGAVVLAFNAATLTTTGEGAQVLDVPAVSGNSLRHQLVRGPGWLVLCDALGLLEAAPGAGELPAAVEALFVNGGNIKAGAKQPNNPFGLAAQIRATYPLLDLLGGVVDSFDLGESRLKVAAWVVCRENRAAFAGTVAADLPAASVSIFDLLDDVTHTRQATGRGEGQMIYSFQTLCAGTQLLVRLSVDRGARLETIGALASAIAAYETGHARVGGQGARGFGAGRLTRVAMPPRWPEAADAYYAHLAAERNRLRAALCDGTLGTGRPLLS